MTKQELNEVFESDSAAIIAPAGHGKTEMIVEMVKKANGKQLLLTHTNAGVDALKKRLKKHNVSSKKYEVSTIAAFCIRWCVAYHYNANFNVLLSPIDNAREYYAQIYEGMAKILSHNWSGTILKATYDGVIVDEYQDCTLEQHSIMLSINNYLPMRVLGDPLQGIFSFAGALVNWNNIEYKIVHVQTRPWRWENTNPLLGEELSILRTMIKPTLLGRNCTINLSEFSNNIEFISKFNFDHYKLLNEIQKYNSVIYITKWPNEQLNFCKKMPGVFQNDEVQECKELFSFAKNLDEKTGIALARTILLFISNCATGVSKNLLSYIRHLDSNNSDFTRIRNYPDLAKLLTDVINNKSVFAISEIIQWFFTKKEFKFFRKELAEEMIRSLDYAGANDITIFEASNHVRKDVHLQKKYNKFKYLSSRTLLSKGLEFDCVIVDMSTQLSAKDFYVALTRAMKKIYVISDSPIITLYP